MGFTRYLIFYQPLTSLGYIFGYNQKIPDEDGLFAYVNYGLLIFLLPFIAFGVAMIVGKINYERAPTQQTKLYLLI